MHVHQQQATELFLRLPEEKQQKVFQAAVLEFAAHGFEGANTNKIAKRASVSVGSLFQYFRTKQALFLALVDYGTQTFLVPVIESARDAQDVLALFRQMLYSARQFATEQPAYNRVYLGLTTQLPNPMSTLLMRRIEERTIASYRRAMRKMGMADDAHSGCIAFLLDNLVVTYQFSFASEYYKARLLAYTGLDPQEQGDALIDALCSTVSRLL